MPTHVYHAKQKEAHIFSSENASNERVNAIPKFETSLSDPRVECVWC